ncbi:uroporphyrinogen decarboxylase family protein [Desulfomonile tiedjei]|uniref:Uroporphyrinogen-III decarboxylase n=1 Tax=Desulfomonile tiedjei (strain ATCC 49306 / DSM 6799 / DCB-1) TaxID=706587 RepID=I4CEP3_DESTA|nr:uroporphyrinogen decarboxylase family protein [Desulfomonile tiedjei]AFM28034.1 uroporphyrinogen-III decarboxylase [Desulfomonile tiedjei DSM 6799]
MEDVQIVPRQEVTGSRLRLAQLLAGSTSGRPLIDLGTTSLTGIRTGVVHGVPAGRGTANPIHATLALEATDCLRLGSDFLCTGLLFDEPEIADGQWADPFGVQWLCAGKTFSPLGHPLETAELLEVTRHPRPLWLQPVQHIEPEIADRNIVIADAPCPGLLDLCFLLRNSWKFMEDCTTNWQMASALLDWSLETIVESYAYMLGKLARKPDVIVYCDDLGFGNSMFFSPSDFRTYIRPRLRDLLTRLRSLTSAAICFHSCGAIRPILSDIADLGIEIVNLDTRATDMGVRQIRQGLPASVVLHVANDLCALGAALEDQDKASIASLITELAHSVPVIAAPLDSLSSMEEVLDAVRGATLIRNLSHDDFDSFRNVGPIRSIIEEASRKTMSARLPKFDSQLIHTDAISHYAPLPIQTVRKEVGRRARIHSMRGQKVL